MTLVLAARPASGSQLSLGSRSSPREKWSDRWIRGRFSAGSATPVITGTCQPGKATQGELGAWPWPHSAPPIRKFWLSSLVIFSVHMLTPSTSLILKHVVGSAIGASGATTGNLARAAARAAVCAVLHCEAVQRGLPALARGHPCSPSQYVHSQKTSSSAIDSSCMRRMRRLR